MPDTIVAPNPDLQPPPNHDPTDAYRQFFSDEGKLKGPEDAPITEPPVEAKQPDSKAAPAPKTEKTDGAIPDQFLTDKKDEPVVDEFAEMVKEAPKGQIAHERFVKLQQLSQERVASALKERDELRAQLDEIRTKGGAPENVQKEIEALRKRADEAEAELERTAYERTPKFRQQYVEPENRLKDSVKGIGKEYGLPESDVEDLMSLKGKRRDDMIEGLDITSAAKQRLITELSHLDRLGAERETELSRSREQLRSVHEEQQRAAKAESERARQLEDRIFGEELEVGKSKLPGFMRVDGNEAWNREVEARIEHAKNFFNGKVHPDPQEALRDMTRLILRGMNGDVQDKILARYKAENAKLLEQVTKLSAAGPGGGQPPSGQGDQNGKHDPGSTFDHFMNQARQQQG